ncbi:hypothetical protein [Brevibacillus daliensis]|uniref:hypothetical protein n=1 Tax=Brevibacillus daliensis TaxID=2892995 RepID=UPI001E47C020|nr:hypothetical protein [Brevibacillus daliensis]
MGFCCGAGMIGSLGTIRHESVLVHNVPIMYCPVCNRTRVQPALEAEYDILLEYALGDQATEVDFAEFVDTSKFEHLFENCSMTDQGSYVDSLKKQIDIALDLLGVAKQMNDKEWREALVSRLTHLSERLRQYQANGQTTRNAR